MPETRPPSRRARLLLALGLGGWGALLHYLTLIEPQGRVSDFDQVWAAAGALLAGSNPYAVIGPALPFEWPWPFLYPITAPTLIGPLAMLPVLPARLVFFGISCGLLAYAISRRGVHGLLLFGSAGFLVTANLVQWSPLLMAAGLMPWLGLALAAKPNLGLALFLAWPSRIAAAGIVGLVAISLLVMPQWPVLWWDAAASSPHVFAPITQPAGFILLLALLRWRLPEARLLLALACIPHTPGLYDALPLFLVAANALQSAALLVLSYAAFFGIRHFGPYPDFYAFNAASGRLIFVLMYLPSLIFLLSRQDGGSIPSLLRRFPARIRGSLVQRTSRQPPREPARCSTLGVSCPSPEVR